MRRCPLRGQENIWKRQLIHVGAFNRSLILRQRPGAGTRREWKNRCGRLVLTLYLLFPCRMNQKRFCRSRISATVAQCFVRSRSLVAQFSTPAFTAGLGAQGELMFDAALPTVGFLPTARKVRSYSGKEWTETEHNLDRVFERDGIAYGVVGRRYPPS